MLLGGRHGHNLLGGTGPRQLGTVEPCLNVQAFRSAGQTDTFINMTRARLADSPRSTANRTGSPASLLCTPEPATDDCCECCGDAFTDTSPASPSSVDPSICEWCYVNGYDDDCDQNE
jgi:hypothetical protein